MMEPLDAHLLKDLRGLGGPPTLSMETTQIIKTFDSASCVRNCSSGCSQVHSGDEYGTDLSLEQFADGYSCKQ